MEKSEAKSHGKKLFTGKGDPRNGRGPKPGAPNAGRPRDEWKAWLRSVVDSPESQRAIVQVISDPSHPAHAKVLQWAAERGYGKETESVEHSGRDGAPIAITVTRRVIRPNADG